MHPSQYKYTKLQYRFTFEIVTICPRSSDPFYIVTTICPRSLLQFWNCTALDIQYFYHKTTTVCPGSSDPIYIVTSYIKWVTTLFSFSGGAGGWSKYPYILLKFLFLQVAVCNCFVSSEWRRTRRVRAMCCWTL